MKKVSAMSTHGDIFICDKESDDPAAFHGQWMHAYSDGDIDSIYNELINLPEWVARRSKLALEHPELGIGKAWWFRTLKREANAENRSLSSAWDSHISVCAEVWYNNMSAMISSRWFDRWCPIKEAKAPYHTLGDDPDLLIICDGGTFEIVPRESHLERVTVDYLVDLKKWMDILIQETH